MSAIIDINEPWAGHTFKEIETFVKGQLDEMQQEIDEILNPDEEEEE